MVQLKRCFKRYIESSHVSCHYTDQTERKAREQTRRIQPSKLHKTLNKRCPIKMERDLFL